MKSSTEGAKAAQGTESGRGPIRPRAMELPFDGDIPRHWLNGNALASHLANGVNLLFPAGERFFVRSVRRYLPQIEDPALRKQIQGFSGQEGLHAHHHERFFGVIERQGFRVDGFLRRYQRIAYGLFEKLTPKKLRLSITVAAEHFTAILAESALGKGILEDADPRVRELLLWHAAEEIEHKSVAFDVLTAVGGGYLMRMAGLVVASMALALFWLDACVSLLRQDPEVSLGRLRQELRRIREIHPVGREVFWRGIREYVRRDFHPWQNDNGELARRYFAERPASPTPIEARA